MRRLILAASAALLLISGCSTKESFEPETTVGSWPSGVSLPNEIVDVTHDGALLEEGEVLTKEGVLGCRLPEGFRFLGISEGKVLAAKNDGTLRIAPADGSGEAVEKALKQNIAGAALKGDMLAVLFTDNDMALYSASTGDLLMKERGSAPLAVDNRIVNPRFFNDLVLFPTLDGKVVIIHAAQKQVLRSIIVSSDAHFNNVIYLELIGNTMVAATPSTVFALADKEVREAYDLRDVVFDADGIWLCTKQGEVIALTPSLQLKAKQKFPFAHFLGMIVTDKEVFLLEKEGYLIKLDKALTGYEVYDADVEEGFVYAGKRAFYFDSESMPVE